MAKETPAKIVTAAHHVPEIRDVIYDTDTKSFRDARTGREFTNGDFQTLADARAAREAHAGRNTLKRAALVNSVSSGKISASDWSKSLNELAGGKMGGGIRGSALEDKDYSNSSKDRPEAQSKAICIVLDDKQKNSY